MYPNPPVSPFINFQMTKLSDYPDEGYDHTLDNLEELQHQGWIPGQACLIEVDEQGHLGPCLPLPAFDLNHLLLGLGIICLLICWTIHFIKRIYRCKSRNFLYHLPYFFSLPVSTPLCYLDLRLPIQMLSIGIPSRFHPLLAPVIENVQSAL